MNPPPDHPAAIALGQGAEARLHAQPELRRQPGEAVSQPPPQPLELPHSGLETIGPKRTEIELQRSERALRAISACDQALVHAATEAELLEQICRAIVALGGYRMAWVGFPEHNPAKTFRVAAVAGHESDYLAEVKISWSEAEESGRGPTGRAFRTGRRFICQDLQTDPIFAPWRAEAARRGYASSIALPLRDADKTFGIVMIYAGEVNAFQPAEVALLTTMSEDLAYGLQALRTRLQHQQTEAALAASETRFRAIFHSSAVATAILEPDSTVSLVNDMYCQLTGYTRAELIGQCWHQWVAPEDLERLTEYSRRRLMNEPGVPAQYAFRFIHKQGEVRHCQIAVALIPSSGQVIASMLDITESKRVVTALRESEENHRGILINAPVGVFQSSPDRVLFVNPAMAAMFGYASPAEMLAENPNPSSYFVHPEQRSQMIRQALTSGTYVSQEVQERRKDGSLFTTSTQLRVVCDATGNVKFVEGFVQDITERKRMEESHARLATAIEQAAEAVVITDTKGVILYANPAFERSAGYTRAEALGQNPRVLKSGKHDAEYYRQLWDTLQRGEVWTGRFVNKRKDGTLYEEEATISPVRDASGATINYVAVKRDVTHEVQLEAQVRQTQKMEAIGTLAGGIAHDFNNMLGAMFGYAHLLQEDTAGNPLAQESVAEILRAANRAKDLVQQILTFSRQREQKPQIIQLNPIVKEAIKFLRASLPAHIKIELELSAEAPAVLADPTQIYQVTMNLATNALHAMEEGPGRLTVGLDVCQPEAKLLHAHPQLRPMRYTRLTVADTGHGMDAKTLERIFEPFFTTKPVGRGTGLGLAVVHGIMQTHNGVITVESQVGQGTTFRLYFPAETKAETMSPAAAGAVPRGHGQRILVLDDETALTTVLQIMLRRLGYQAATSNHASQAIQMYRENPTGFDLVITDLTMPEMNGLEVARQLHAIRPNLPVILVSGHSVSADADRLRAAGIGERLDKPVSLGALAGAVERALKPQPV
jgi:PAS domain S-box-containing protein